ncbi:MAG: hypothetical protein EWV53_22315 [Microcystis panniformis Mp_MB_F_20051200_S9]|uniref:Uncharacterized protein n=1 Tax=Microcystis panniformis Mp_MB_F_20051200_S9 TaxID=2486223 RepID=A0A552PI92_9CHRO|nr:MAG: hypothetical protein EWV42_24280 [Microcystis panniformis Mp_GB_SS_20050300_S99D]TRV48600.1 MAG: hypothetical protein EWV43_10145 [Microcystis panniformis Mp_MB_F_20080800_S26D]TRV52470.1 MAG: hypothetical protein EWV87_04800 [Microcystis panniformis Mp_GB_SS_20050300_S99]TRV56389.1 MAG: hypothetical protein EWV86_22645 [Microcystis panniformis Mp_MB_F_20051200_S9D]TRV56717.1 MAG: hypothetical protein EWV53_22315 [Microcystis panniformis Mp_MB_F_20051200_S9]TRV57503.1 MAG: hypothetical
MVYLGILCNLILIFTVFEPSKINYARGLIKYHLLLGQNYPIPRGDSEWGVELGDFNSARTTI